VNANVFREIRHVPLSAPLRAASRYRGGHVVEVKYHSANRIVDLDNALESCYNLERYRSGMIETQSDLAPF
jgi:hypothetical protein